MPGHLEIRFQDAAGGMTPAQSVLSWVERTLEIDDAGHSAQRKPYAVEARQSGAHLDARITVADAECLNRLASAVGTGRHAINGGWTAPQVIGARFVTGADLLAAAPPRTKVRVRVVSPVVFSNGGMDDPVLTSQRLFGSARARWEAHETLPPPAFNTTANVELLAVDGRSVPYFAFSQHRGWQGVMDLKLHGTTEEICAGNALLAYGELWGIGKATTVGAGRIEVHDLPRRPRVAR